MTKIEWTHPPGWSGKSWNPIVGCSKASAGCTNCYALPLAHRMASNPATPHYAGTTARRGGKTLWTGKMVQAPMKTLLEPLRRKKPTVYFANSMSDLFHESVQDEWIDLVFAMMALCPQHRFIVLTKRSERMRKYFIDALTSKRVARFCVDLWVNEHCDAADLDSAGAWPVVAIGDPENPDDLTLRQWSLLNVILGVSVENQECADERIPDLLATPAACRMVSIEPMLGPVDVRQWLHHYGCGCGWGGDDPLDYCNECGWRGHASWSQFDDPPCPDCGSEITDYNACPDCDGHDGDGMSFGPNSVWLDWIICGGESGPNARDFDLAWREDVRRQCLEAGVALFEKQLGSNPIDNGRRIILKNPAGKDPTEWPGELCIREFPRCLEAA